MEKKKEQAKVLSQEMLADGIYSLWIETEAALTARPGQFVSVYTADASKLLPRPISICEIDKEAKRLRLVYRVTGEKTGTKQFSELKAGDFVPVIGPLGNGFPYEKAEGNTKANQKPQTRFLQNGAYLSIRNISLSYTFPIKLIKPLGITNLSVFFSGENLFTFDHLPKGIDAERVVTDNLGQRGFTYPYMRQFSFGINLSL